ncbi:SCO2322 family protein [Streptacidiphilus rugosus]|uniref:SCO2322 family protein n=1 Tax=Streptacidiphilus rugosus TaxID=405783 RepID=UPI0006917074|nr:SCO2322 family protein [Streptacidiphilus rugosus]
MIRTRTARAAAVLAVALLALPLLLARPASATAYRYWSFWSWAGNGWSYQQQGPNTAVPADGSVDGWRFGVSVDSAHAVQPRSAATPSFAELCARTPAVSGKKRVAVVLDYGTDSGAPAERTGCAVLSTEASSAQLLAQLVPPLRYDSNGILCAISGYPAQGCGEAVADNGSAPPAAAAPKSGGSSAPVVGWAAGAALVVALGGAAWWRNRRRANGN